MTRITSPFQQSLTGRPGSGSFWISPRAPLVAIKFLMQPRTLLLPLLSTLSPAGAAWLASPATPAQNRAAAASSAAASTRSTTSVAVGSDRAPVAAVRAVLADPTAASGARPSIPGSQTKTTSVGILLLNLGGPDTLDNVEPFLYNLFSDPEIITLPSSLAWMNGPLAYIISRSRGPTSREGYASIGGSSPQLATTLAQGKALEESLASKGIEAKTYVAMRYWHPFTEEALEDMKADGVQRLIVLPLYPQFSISTSGSSLRLLERLYYSDQQLRQMRAVVIPSWFSRPGYVASLARLIKQKCDTFDDANAPHIFFSAHGLPKK